MTQSMKTSARLDPLPPETTPELKEEFDSFFKTLGFVPNSVLTMQRKPKFAKAFVQMQRALWDPDSKVDRGFKRLVAYVASRAAGDVYSMAHTASGALHFGIPQDKLLAARDCRTSPLFNAQERSAFELAIAASAVPNAVGESHFIELRKHWTEDQIVELAGVIAMAGFLARWNGTMATPIEAEPQQVGERHLAVQGWAPGIHRR